MSGEWSEGAEYRLDALGEGLLADANSTALHRAFGDYLIKVAGALRALSLELSSDAAAGSANSALEALLSPADVLRQAVDRAERAHSELGRLLERAREA